jgi:hypothetical protein
MEHAQLDEIDGAISLLFKKEEIGCLCLNVFKVKVLRENKVILLIDVWVYIPSEQLPLRRFTSEAAPRI